MRSHLRRSSLLACAAAAGTLLLLAAPAEAASPAWSVTPSPSPHGADVFDGVSCTSQASCMAVGSYNGGAGTLAETWNGHIWSVTSSISPGGNPDELLGVSCTGPSFCAAVGWNYNSSTNVYQTLAEIWNGSTWTVTPTISPNVQNVLYGVYCLSSADCIAVGYTDAAGGFATLVETWNGSSWSVTPSPNGGTDSVLQAITCKSASSCQAVGSYQGTFGELTLTESWNGSGWKVTPSANPGSGNNALLGVSCTSSTSCMAVGFYSVGFGPERTLAEAWNGSNWTVRTTPNRTPRNDDLQAVSCVNSSHCVAAGFWQNSSSTGQTLIETWNGSRWSDVGSPNPGADDQLHGVSCTATTSCEAVGYTGNGSLISDKTLVETGS